MANFLYYLLIIPVYIFSLIPLRIQYVIADLLAFVLERVVRYRSYVIYTNLARSFPSKKYNELKKIARANYRFIADNFVETIWAVSASEKRLAKMVKIKNPEVLGNIYNSGRSAIVAMGHKGNWELLGSLDIYADNGALGYKGSDVMFLYKKVKNKLFDKITHWIRVQHTLGHLVESDEAPRFMFKHRHEICLFCLIADQSPHPGSKFAVDFLNQPTLMINGPEQLSKMLGYPVVYLDMDKIKRGKYEIILTLISDDPKKEEDGYITTRYARLLEADISRNPSIWLWSHKRWKRNIEELKEKNKHQNNE